MDGKIVNMHLPKGKGFDTPVVVKATEVLRASGIRVKILGHGEPGNTANGKVAFTLPNGTRLEGFGNICNRVREKIEEEKRIAAKYGNRERSHIHHHAEQDLVPVS